MISCGQELWHNSIAEIHDLYRILRSKIENSLYHVLYQFINVCMQNSFMF